MYTLKLGFLQENAPISQKQTQLAGLSGRKCAEFEITRGEKLGTGARFQGVGLEAGAAKNHKSDPELRIPNQSPESRVPSPESRIPRPDHLVRHYMLATKRS